MNSVSKINKIDTYLYLSINLWKTTKTNKKPDYVIHHSNRIKSFIYISHKLNAVFVA